MNWKMAKLSISTQTIGAEDVSGNEEGVRKESLKKCQEPETTSQEVGKTGHEDAFGTSPVGEAEDCCHCWRMEEGIL